MKKSAFLSLLFSSLLLAAIEPGVVTEITYPCKYDNSRQPALLMTTDAPGARPLFVVLHTWSSNYAQNKHYGKRLKKHGVYFIAPNFRGPNTSGDKLAMGSDAAISDIIDAVEYMKKNYSIDTKRIYLIGGSGGGYMSLLTGARHPEIWAGIASFCPISDLVRWHAERKGISYGAHIAKIVGNPQTSAEAKAEAIRRSPVTWLAGLKVPLDIVAGINDRTVAATHAVRAFNCVAAEADRIPEADIACIGENRKVPAHYPEVKEKLARKKIFLRRVSGNVRLTLFDAGHVILPEDGIQWLLNQHKDKPADFTSATGSGKTENLGK